MAWGLESPGALEYSPDFAPITKVGKTELAWHDTASDGTLSPFVASPGRNGTVDRVTASGLNQQSIPVYRLTCELAEPAAVLIWA
eukprot:6213638-Amphidinium_carterae.1